MQEFLLQEWSEMFLISTEFNKNIPNYPEIVFKTDDSIHDFDKKKNLQFLSDFECYTDMVTPFVTIYMHILPVIWNSNQMQFQTVNKETSVQITFAKKVVSIL